MSTIEMPKTMDEQLDELEIGKGFPISSDKRRSWASKITIVNKESVKQFSVRTDDETGEILVCRKKDKSTDVLEEKV